VNRRAFTLIELLVVIGVVAVLIGLLAPALAAAVGTARRVACQVNLRSIGQAMTMYLDAGDGMLPYAWRDADVADGVAGPWSELAPFLDAPFPVVDAVHGGAVTGDPWACPADDELGPVTGFSYWYGPTGVLHAGLGRRWATRMFLGDSAGVLAVDTLPVHPGSGDAARNALAADGSVRPFGGVLFTVR
jgi:prepilin-type N-terminal cleavage/methylation domain-containing protein